MGFTVHSAAAVLSILLSTVGFIPYALAVYRGTTKPHVFTWLIWTLVTVLVFIAQLWSGGGAGAWTTAAIAAMCLVALIAGIFRGEKTRTPFDWVCLIAALAAIPLWMLSGSPRASVILLTFIEAAGLGLKYFFGAVALDRWSLEMALYPVATCFMAFGFTILLVVCRRVKKGGGVEKHPRKQP